MTAAADTLIDRAFALHAAGRPAEAAACLDTALQQAPRHPAALHLRGVIAGQLGNPLAAVSWLAAASEADPTDASIRCNLGNAQLVVGDLAAAAASYLAALKLEPANTAALYNLGNLYKQSGRNGEALQCYSLVFQLDPAHVQAWNNAGLVLIDIGRLDEAERCLRRVLDLDAGFVAAYVNLGRSLADLGKLGEAIDVLRRGVDLAPAHAGLHANLGNALLARGDAGEAVAAFRRSIELDPANAAAYSGLMFALDFDPTTSAAAQQAARRQWYRDCIQAAGVQRCEPAPTDGTDRKLRIGYVSGDFRCTSAAQCFAPMLLDFDRDRFEVICYSTSPRADGLTARFQASASGWRSIAEVDDATAARLIRADRVDILVDLSAHMSGHRLGVFARRPAPIQITAWGYANGTGMPEIDVLFADPVFMPAEIRPLLAEKVVDLPSVIPYVPFDTPPPLTPPPALARGYTCFGCFSRLAKISDACVRLWARLLDTVPAARLVIKSSTAADAGTLATIRGKFETAGVAPNRLDILPRTLWYPHLEALAGVDILLDPFPHGGGVSLLEGLLMGVPSLARRGRTPAALLSSALLGNVGLDDWIADSEDEFIDLAVQHAGDPAILAKLRGELRSRLLASPIGDLKSYVAAVETAYRQLWQDYRGQPG